VTASLPPPGWYPDPWGAGMQRYFDGHNWTPHRAPAQGSTVSASAPVAPPGWYPDPWDAGMQRYFDGHNWTPQCAPAQGQSIRHEDFDSSLPSFSVNRAASDQRKASLESYLMANVWNPREGFICTSASKCRSSAHQCGASFYEAQGHMVGPSYDMHVNGTPYRVLVLPMETGEPKQHRTVDQRTKDVLDAGKLASSNATNI
jgi:hypothetical protein